MTEDTINATSENYRVNLEVFSGPMDLLLYLIRQEEVDIYDIPIARITRQYLKYVELMKTLDLEVAGEFILMAATLIRIKARLLLPAEAGESDEPDPREELIMALVEYKKYKEAGEILRHHALEEEQLYVPPAPVEKIDGRVDLEPATSLFDLLTAFKEVLETQYTESAAHEVNPERISIEDRILFVMQLLQNRESATFVELFADIPLKTVAVVTFIALLELTRSRRIRLYQAVPFSEVRVYRGVSFNKPHMDIDFVDSAVGTKEGTENDE